MNDATMLLIVIVSICYAGLTTWMITHTMHKVEPMATAATMLICVPVSLYALASSIASIAILGLNWSDSIGLIVGLFFTIATGYLFKPIIQALHKSSSKFSGKVPGDNSTGSADK